MMADDGEKLYRDFGIIARGLVELGALAHFADDAFSNIYKRRVVSLAKMTAMYLKRDLMKSKERTGNWEGDLNNKMLHCEHHNVTRRNGTNLPVKMRRMMRMQH